MVNRRKQSGLILVLVHRVFKNEIPKLGGADLITNFLKTKGYTSLYVEHPLNGVHPTIVRSEDHILKRMEFPFSGVLRWLFELMFNFFYLLGIKEKCALIIAVDPLNFLSAYPIRLFKNVKIHFHSIDYSESRFNNLLLDGLYNLLYAFAVKNADMVTYVSVPMGEKIRSIVGSNHRNIVSHLPNSPEFSRVKRIMLVDKVPRGIVYTKTFISDSELKRLFEMLEIVEESFKGVVLHVIGETSSGMRRWIKDTQLSKNIKFWNLLNYEKNMEIVCNSYIGLAWYENVKSFEKYADSLKLREYAASGLPSICNGEISTALEMREAGAGFIANDTRELSKCVSTLLGDEKLYLGMRENAIKWAKENDKTMLLNTLYKSVLW